jgi:hypothetical protein
MARRIVVFPQPGGPVMMSFRFSSHFGNAMPLMILTSSITSVLNSYIADSVTRFATGIQHL